MYAYKAFKKDYSCRGFRFSPYGEWSETDKANCRSNGFHAATNPLDCLSYYPDFKNNAYAVVECAGDMDEDAYDSKITCTRMRIVETLTPEDFIIEALFYIGEHPKLALNRNVRHNEADAGATGFAIAEGANPRCKGTQIGDILGFVKRENGCVINHRYAVVDGKTILPDVWYSYDDIRGERNE